MFASDAHDTKDGCSWLAARRAQRGVLAATVVYFCITLMAHGQNSVPRHGSLTAKGDASNEIGWERALKEFWGAITGSVSLVFQDKLWILGGTSTIHEESGKVWASLDGVDWTQVYGGVPWVEEDTPRGARTGHTGVNFNGRMWILGGWQSTSGPNGENYTLADKADVWSSLDGAAWDQVTASAPWGPRRNHTSVVHNGRIWVLGGYSLGDYRNDVWSSLDGLTWTQATPDAVWPRRSRHTSVVFKNRIWVLGGESEASENFRLNDVWSSSDGMNWRQETASASWTPRFGHSSVVFDGGIWVLGGSIDVNAPISVNDVWRLAEDGVNWLQVNRHSSFDPRWVPRSGHTSAVYKNRIWVIGGSGQGDFHPDIWYSDMGGEGEGEGEGEGQDSISGIAQDLWDEFDALDADADGRLSMAEAAAQGVSQESFDRLDANGDGLLTRADLVAAGAMDSQNTGCGCSGGKARIEKLLGDMFLFLASAIILLAFSAANRRLGRL
jgi:N-acetylneuraminic acid mutarotase